ncbi:MAG TPA: hypothetical protein VFJ97_16720 [Dermatophilaceae bacterium]|nr:hypothetical protein [Dermatophilaceae bacterium]
MTRTRLYVAGLGLVLLLAYLLVPDPGRAVLPTAASPLGSRVVFVGTSGLSWNDVSRAGTPTLWSLLDDPTATVTVRSVRTVTCPVDGWLSLSAGQRAADAQTGPRPESRQACRALPGTPAAGRVARWAEYLRAAQDTNFGARLGLLGDQVAAAGECVQAVGPGAAIAAARSDGTVAHYAPYDAGRLPDLVRPCPLTVVDVGAVRDPDEVQAGDQVRPTGSRAEQVRAVDARIGEAVAAAAGTGATVLVGSLADAGDVERLRLAAMTGSSTQGTALVSQSTRQPGLIQAADLTATILARLGLPEAAGVSGRPLLTAGRRGEGDPAQRLQHLVDIDLASHEVHALVPPFFNGWVFTQIAIYGFVAVVWRRRFGTEATRRRLLRVARRVGIVAAAVPVSTFLANLLPWWRSPVPLLAVTAAVGLFVAALSALALLGPWRRRLLGPLAVVCVATVSVLALDVMKGSRLQVSSLMGLQPVVGGRFYGMGNVTFALFATATLLLCIAVADRLTRTSTRLRAGAAVAAVGLAAVVVDGFPSWGADFGGPPALLPGLAYLLLAVLGVRLTWRRAVLVLGGTAAFLVAIGVLDWLRPSDSRSHLGNFVQAVLDGGAYDIVARKAAQNLAILTGSFLTLLIPVGLVFVILVLARPTSWGARALESAYERAPLLRPGLVALLVTALIGFALNDSGTAIPAVAATVALPLVIAVCVQALLEERRPPDVGPTPAR